MTLLAVQKSLRKVSNKQKAKVLQGFFKTGPGEYGEGDIFLGVTVPESRAIAKKFNALSLRDVRALFKSPIHEERLVAVLMLVDRFKCGNRAERQRVYDFYLKNTKYINNWDLVDLSAHYIVGEYLLSGDKSVLYELAKSNVLWERRIAVISTFRFIREGKFNDTLKLSKMLLKDEHDLMHKAVGWMLREVGKRDMAVEEKFLGRHYKSMPRTMLRYAIERFPENKRQKYLKGTI